jgi:hypothetical protein
MSKAKTYTSEDAQTVSHTPIGRGAGTKPPFLQSLKKAPNRPPKSSNHGLGRAGVQLQRQDMEKYFHLTIADAAVKLCYG